MSTAMSYKSKTGVSPTNSDNTEGLAFSDTANYLSQVDLGDLAAKGPKVEIKHTKLFINGEFVESKSGKKFDSINPHDGSVIASVSEADADDVDIAVKAARHAYETVWKHTNPNSRCNLMLRLANLMEQNINTLASLENIDNGKTYGIAKAFDVTEAINTFRYYAGWSTKIQGKTIEMDGPLESRTVHEPFGVVGAIVPWNFPLLMATWKLAPCLACGNTIVLKSSEKTPLTALYLASLFKEAGFPNGVVNILSGYGPTAGQALAAHPDIDKVAFTGSTPVGRKIMHAAADSNLKKVTLELGGKSPTIIFPDVDLDAAVEGASNGLFFNAAQVCCAASRTFVHESIYDEFVAKTKAYVKKIQMSSQSQAFDAQGPLVDDIQYKKVIGFIEEGKKEGAKLEVGGGNAGDGKGKGYHIEPTLFTNVNDDMSIARNEIFGPVQSVFKFSTIDEVVNRANDTPYGLAASVFTNDLNVATVVANSLKAGTVWINCHNLIHRAAPFGGFKASGIGRDLGEYALAEYTTVKSITTQLPKGMPAMPKKRT